MIISISDEKILKKLKDAGLRTIGRSDKMLSPFWEQVVATKVTLRKEIERRLAQYKQYDHYHDDNKGWKLGYVERTIRFKSGDAVAGEFILVRESTLLDVAGYEIAHLTPGVAYRDYKSEPSVMHCAVSSQTVQKSIVFLEV